MIATPFCIRFFDFVVDLYAVIPIELQLHSFTPKILLVILHTIHHPILNMLVWRIWYWSN